MMSHRHHTMSFLNEMEFAMFPEWNPYLQRIKVDDHHRKLRHAERVAEYRPTRKQRR